MALNQRFGLECGQGGFDPSHFAELAAVEEGSFWFRSRNELIVWAIRAYAPAMASFLEVGCGTGFVLERVARAFPGAALTGSELFAEGLAFARDRIPAARLVQLDASVMPFDAVFDVVGAFDVLEHIEDDRAVLAGMHRALHPGGRLIVTVPQHRALWSEDDVRAHHVRRYRAADFRQKAEAAGFRIERMTSFVSLLLPAMLLSRRFKRAEGAVLRDLRQPAGIDRALAAVMAIERVAIRAKMSFPVGGSLLVVATRRS